MLTFPTSVNVPSWLITGLVECEESDIEERGIGESEKVVGDDKE